MYNILFFILVVLIVSYTVKYLFDRFYPIEVSTRVSDVVLIDRFRKNRSDGVVETITREQYVTREPVDEKRDNKMLKYHINGKLLDKKHLF